MGRGGRIGLACLGLWVAVAACGTSGGPAGQSSEVVIDDPGGSPDDGGDASGDAIGRDAGDAWAPGDTSALDGRTDLATGDPDGSDAPAIDLPADPASDVGVEAADGADEPVADAPCLPRCDGKACGDDGCGGACGACAAGSCGAGAWTPPGACVQGQCAAGGLPVACDDGLDCTSDDCDPIAGCVHVIVPGTCRIDGACVLKDGIREGHPCQACVPDQDPDGWTPVADDTACDDGNACSVPDTTSCQSGVCVARTWKTCAPPASCHAEGACDPGSGACIYAALDNVPCDDGNPGTGPDMCSQGVCVGPPCACWGSQGGCCDGCQPVNEGQACLSDGLSCTEDYCQAGLCLHPIVGGCYIGTQCYSNQAPNPSNACEYCDPPTNRVGWALAQWGTPCDDGSAATLNDQCQVGACVCVPILTLDGCPQGRPGNAGEYCDVQADDGCGQPVTCGSCASGLACNPHKVTWGSGPLTVHQCGP